MSDRLQSDWFSGKPGRILVYRVNRRPKFADSMFPAEIPEDLFEHFRGMLAPGWDVVTGHKNQRVWRIGGLQEDREAQTLTGRLGWKPKGVELKAEWSSEDMDWRSELDKPADHLIPFGFDADSRLLAVVPDPNSNPATIGAVIEKVLRENESDSENPTTDWAVEPVLDRRDFLEWLNGLDIVRSVSFTARQPNPTPDDPRFEELAKRLVGSHASRYSETMASDKEEGLIRVQEDRDFRQAIAMAQQGFATLFGKGERGGQKSKYSQIKTQAAESVEELPHNWNDMRTLLTERLKGALRRYKDGQDEQPDT